MEQTKEVAKNTIIIKSDVQATPEEVKQFEESERIQKLIDDSYQKVLKSFKDRKIEAWYIDFRRWDGFGRFFDSVLFDTLLPKVVLNVGNYSVESVVPVSFFAIAKDTPEEAVEALKADLALVKDCYHPVGFMVLPTLIKLKIPVNNRVSEKQCAPVIFTDAEQADKYVNDFTKVEDFSVQEKYVAFCTMSLVTTRSLHYNHPDISNKLKTLTTEGNVVGLDGPVDLLSIKDMAGL